MTQEMDYLGMLLDTIPEIRNSYAYGVLTYTTANCTRFRSLQRS